jgi:hypothetical protein
MLLNVLRVFFLLLSLFWLSCLPNPDSEEDHSTTPKSCGNGQCEPDLGEDCTTCTKDCSCCVGILAGGAGVENPELANGKSDGKFAEIGELSLLEITVGRFISDNTGADFQLIGQVLSEGQASSSDCPIVTQSTGSILVKVWDGKTWQLTGLWTKASAGSSTANASFDLSCALVSQTIQIRLEAQSNAKARLDAVQALSCTE